MTDNVYVHPATEANRVKVATIERNGVHYPVYSDFLIEVAAGRVPGMSIVHKYGRNPSGVLNTEATVSDLGNMQFPVTATTVRIKAGGNAADTAAGVGAREVTVYGIDATGALVEEALPTNGISASSSTTTSFFRDFRARVTDVGTYTTTGLDTGGSNQDAITIENTAGTDDILRIPQYEGSSEYAAYHIPEGKTAHLLSALIQVDASKNADVILYQRRDILNTSSNIASRWVTLHLDGVVGQTAFKPRSPISFPSLTDIWWTFIPTANGTECSVDFELLLIDD